MRCPYCLFSLAKLIEMKSNGTEFWTAAGRNILRIADIDEKAMRIRLRRMKTGKLTPWLDYKKLEEIHKRIHTGEIDLDPYQIDEVIPWWGNYITGLLKYLGCMPELR